LQASRYCFHGASPPSYVYRHNGHQHLVQRPRPRFTPAPVTGLPAIQHAGRTPSRPPWVVSSTARSRTPRMSPISSPVLVPDASLTDNTRACSPQSRVLQVRRGRTATATTSGAVTLPAGSPRSRTLERTASPQPPQRFGELRPVSARLLSPVPTSSNSRNSAAQHFCLDPPTSPPPRRSRPEVTHQTPANSSTKKLTRAAMPRDFVIRLCTNAFALLAKPTATGLALDTPAGLAA